MEHNDIYNWAIQAFFIVISLLFSLQYAIKALAVNLPH